jgi:alanyl-tRNA synthetase
MLSKEKLREEFSKDYKKFYEVELFKELGFERKRCGCGKYFWSLGKDNCGDPDEHGTEYSFFKKQPESITLDEMWKKFSDFFKKNGYEEISRYPVVSRWRPDLYFTIASIQDFQRIEKGIMDFEYPVNPLIVPQVCLRFNDIPHVGFTGRHLTSFIMAGQHSFNWPKEGYWRDETIRLDYEFLTKELGVKKEEVTFIEDVWAMTDFSEFGACLEAFSKGLEIVNAVFTEFSYFNGEVKELPKKVVDVGWGFERVLWFRNGTPSLFESLFPKTLKKLNVSFDKELYEIFAKKASTLGEKARIDAKTLSTVLNRKENEIEDGLMPLLSSFVILDHIRTLLFAISDGALPSNVGGGYNLRLLLRRAFGLGYKYNIDIYDLIPRVAEESKLFPELKENEEEARKIFEIEEQRYNQTIKNAQKKLGEILTKKALTKEEIKTLYQSNGISLEMIENEAKKRNIQIQLPTYEEIVQQNEVEKQKEETYEVPSIETKLLCYTSSKAKAKVVFSKNNIVVLDQTPFYPESGGQESDKGEIFNKNKKAKVIDVKKQGSTVIHFLDKNPFSEGEEVECVVDEERRKRLRVHHTATHLISTSCRKILGKHAWQEGTLKSFDKAHIDIAHFDKLHEDEVKNIEKLANEFVRKGLEVKAKEMDRKEAEEKYGFSIYQGHGVPSKKLRIIIIGDENNPVDAEACGGLHVSNTSEIGVIKIISTERPHDGIVRINFVAGEAAIDYFEKLNEKSKKISNLLNVNEEKIDEEVKRILEEKIEKEKQDKKEKKEIADEVSKIILNEVKNKEKEILELNFDKEILREIANSIVKENKQICLILKNKKNEVICVCGENSKLKAIEELKKIKGFAGGGREKYAEGVIKGKEDA